jgi:PAS domain S-box-containing protein
MRGGGSVPKPEPTGPEEGAGRGSEGGPAAVWDGALAHSYDELYVTDGDGRTLWVSDASQRLYGMAAEELIGVSVRELERRGVYAPSATRLALARGETVTVRQRTRLGRRLVVTAQPVRDARGEVVRVVCNSRDLDELLAAALGQAGGPAAAARRTAAPDAGEEEDEATLCASPALRAAVEIMRRAAALDVPMLLTGATGVGKTHFARRIHAWSPRREGPFLAIQPASLPEGLFEAELFGYEPGAYTGARREGHPGLLRSAQGGTVLLDEIGELPLALQAKILSFADTGEFIPLGGRRPVRADVRLIVATHRPLGKLVAEGRFRADLYYRLSTMPVAIPPLAERREDILPLAERALAGVSRRYGIHRTLTPDAKEWLVAQPWPGNVRELLHLVTRAAVLATGTSIGAGDLALAHGAG